MEDNVKRNKRIAEWQKEKRVVILVKDKEALKTQAKLRGHDSVNAYINKLIDDDMKAR